MDIGIGLGIIGIIATIGVGIGVYKLQQKEKQSTDNILKKINEITENQARIIESFDNRRVNHIQWFVHHVGGVLKSLIESYRELLSRIQIYQITKSDLDLNRIIGGINRCKISLNQLRSLAERDIPLAAAHLSNPWIPGKFLDAISLLDIGISNDKEEIRSMEIDEFMMWEGSISQRISEMKEYLDTIQREEATRTN